MSDPQAWVIVGVFATAMLGGLTLVVTMLSRVIRAEVGGLRAEIGGLRAEMKGEIAAVRADMAAQFAEVRGDIRSLDRDVQVLSERHWRGEQRG